MSLPAITRNSLDFHEKVTARERVVVNAIRTNNKTVFSLETSLNGFAPPCQDQFWLITQRHNNSHPILSLHLKSNLPEFESSYRLIYRSDNWEQRLLRYSKPWRKLNKYNLNCQTSQTGNRAEFEITFTRVWIPATPSSTAITSRDMRDPWWLPRVWRRWHKMMYLSWEHWRGKIQWGPKLINHRRTRVHPYIEFPNTPTGFDRQGSIVDLESSNEMPGPTFSFHDSLFM